MYNKQTNKYNYFFKLKKKTYFIEAKCNMYKNQKKFYICSILTINLSKFINLLMLTINSNVILCYYL